VPGKLGSVGRVSRVPSMNWPLVHDLDDGIRPAGDPGSCFYCNQKIGSPHREDCVIVTKRVLVRIKSFDDAVTGMWELDVPYCWDRSMIEFMYNDGSWCADNIFDYDSVAWDQPNAKELLNLMSCGGCLCDKIRFEFTRVVDGSPKRKIKSEQ